MDSDTGEDIVTAFAWVISILLMALIVVASGAGIYRLEQKIVGRSPEPQCQPTKIVKYWNGKTFTTCKRPVDVP